MPDVWLLYRTSEHPRVGGFDSEEAAQEWADEHALVDWEARRIAANAGRGCAKCDRDPGWTGIRVPGGGLLGDDAVYCGRAGSACRKTGLAELLRLGHRDLHDKAEAERAARAAELAKRREAKALERRVWKAGVEAVTASTGDAEVSA